MTRKVPLVVTCCQVLDVDGNRRLSFEQLREGLQRLRIFPTIDVTEEDFDRITEVHTHNISLTVALDVGTCEPTKTSANRQAGVGGGVGSLG